MNEHPDPDRITADVKIETDAAFRQLKDIIKKQREELAMQALLMEALASTVTELAEKERLLRQAADAVPCDAPSLIVWQDHKRFVWMMEHNAQVWPQKDGRWTMFARGEGKLPVQPTCDSLRELIDEAMRQTEAAE